MLQFLVSIEATPALAAEAAGYLALLLPGSEARENQVRGSATESALQGALGAVDNAWGANVAVRVDTHSISAGAPASLARAVLAETNLPDSVPLEADPVPAVEYDGPPLTVAFRVRLKGADKRALVEQGERLCAKLAGMVAFAEPPTCWDDDGAWCISGKVADLVIVKGACASVGILQSAVERV